MRAGRSGDAKRPLNTGINIIADRVTSKVLLTLFPCARILYTRRMSTEPENEGKSSHLKDKIRGAAQSIIGEIEELAGVINADPLAQEEGEFNVEVGRVREDAADDLDKESGEK